METRGSPGPGATATSTEDGSSDRSGAPAAGAQGVGKRTTRVQMLSHYADTAAMREALIAGKLADYQGAAAAVAGDDWTPTERAAFAQRARAAAAAARAAPSLVEASLALGALGDVCASCHLASGAPQIPSGPEQPIDVSNPRMLAHAVASDRLWAGLTLPSDESWSSGVRLLLQDPGLAELSDEVSPAARLLIEFAHRAERAEAEERGRVFADILLTCSGCHERLGVRLDHGVVAR